MTYIVGDNDKQSLDELAHYGVMGMKWGVRKENDTGTYKLQTQTVVDKTIHQSTQAAGKEVASLIGKRYNYHISEIKSIDSHHSDAIKREPGLMGFVESTPGKNSGVVYASSRDIRKSLKDAEDIDWFAKDCGNVRAFLTHESAHAIFHSEQKKKAGLLGVKVVGGNIKARDKALKASIKAAKREGISTHLFASKVSGYAGTDGTREEIEAELFSQYHWGSDSPNFVKVWGETLHRELGLDDTPFREGV